MEQRIGINVSFLFARKDIWREVGALFQVEVANAVIEPYGHDEETIRVIQAHPNWFRLAGRNHRGDQRALSNSRNAGTLWSMARVHGRPTARCDSPTVKRSLVAAGCEWAGRRGDLW